MTLLPSTENGYLPYFLLYTSLSATIHTLTCYLSSPQVATVQFRGPSAPQPTSLLAHVYGVKNVYTALIRLYAAYHLDNRELYILAMFTFVGVLWLYVSEMVVYKTVRMKEAVFPWITAGGGLVWMGMGWSRAWY